MRGVYVLQLSNGLTYVGKSRDIKERLKGHETYAPSLATEDANIEEIIAIFKLESGNPRLLYTEEFVTARLAEKNSLEEVSGGTMTGEKKNRIRRKPPSEGFLEAIQGTRWEWLDDNPNFSEDNAEWTVID